MPVEFTMALRKIFYLSVLALQAVNAVQPLDHGDSMVQRAAPSQQLPTNPIEGLPPANVTLLRDGRPADPFEYIHFPYYLTAFNYHEPYMYIGEAVEYVNRLSDDLVGRCLSIGDSCAWERVVLPYDKKLANKVRLVMDYGSEKMMVDIPYASWTYLIVALRTFVLQWQDPGWVPSFEIILMHYHDDWKDENHWRGRSHQDVLKGIRRFTCHSVQIDERNGVNCEISRESGRLAVDTNL